MPGSGLGYSHLGITLLSAIRDVLIIASILVLYLLGLIAKWLPGPEICEDGTAYIGVEVENETLVVKYPKSTFRSLIMMLIVLFVHTEELMITTITILLLINIVSTHVAIDDHVDDQYIHAAKFDDITWYIHGKRRYISAFVSVLRIGFAVVVTIAPPVPLIEIVQKIPINVRVAAFFATGIPQEFPIVMSALWITKNL